MGARLAALVAFLAVVRERSFARGAAHHGLTPSALSHTVRGLEQHLGIVPKAILFNKANIILIQGAALADLAMCDRFEDGDVTQLIRTGQKVRVDPPAGVVTLLE